MKTFAIQVIFLLIVIMGSLFFSFKNEKTALMLFTNPDSQTQVPDRLKINDTLIDIEVADTAKKRAEGLSGRDGLASNSGVLFVFEKPDKYRFWMKGMRFPLDMIFINDGKVVDILKNVPVPTPNQADSALPVYQPVVPMIMLLEVNANFADTNRIKVGDNVFLVKTPKQ